MTLDKLLHISSDLFDGGETSQPQPSLLQLAHGFRTASAWYAAQTLALPRQGKSTVMENSLVSVRPILTPKSALSLLTEARKNNDELRQVPMVERAEENKR